jgi:hypothetical protein
MVMVTNCFHVIMKRVNYVLLFCYLFLFIYFISLEPSIDLSIIWKRKCNYVGEFNMKFILSILILFYKMEDQCFIVFERVLLFKISIDNDEDEYCC